MSGPKVVVPGTPKGKKAVAGTTYKYNPSADDMRRWAEVAARFVPGTQKRYKGAVKVLIRAIFSRPLGHFKRLGRGLRATAAKFHTQKPDSDNIGKFVGDCLSGLAFHDDAQVHSLRVEKEWTPDDRARTEVELWYV